MTSIIDDPKFVDECIKKAIRGRLRLTVQLEDSKDEYASLFLDLINRGKEKYICIDDLSPKVDLKIGDTLNLNFLLDKYKYIIRVKLIEEILGDLKSLLASYPDEVEYVQRREHYRVEPPYRAPILINWGAAIVEKDGQDITNVASDDIRRFDSKVFDISVGGIGCNVRNLPVHFEKYVLIKEVYIKIPFYEQFTCCLQIRYIREIPGTEFRYRCGMQFIDLPVDIQKLINEYVVNVQREDLRKMHEQIEL